MKLHLAAALFVCLIVVPAAAQLPQFGLEPVTQGEIVSPTAIANAGDGSNRLFVTDQRGAIHVIQNGSLLPTPLLDLGSKLVTEQPNFDERGLLGLEFHPNFGGTSGFGTDKFYVYYSAPSADAGTAENPINHQSVVAEYSMSNGDPNIADAGSERILMTFNQPQFNHNAGNLAFGPDGMLYITTGDGGGGGDNEPGHTGGGPGEPTGGLGNAQDRSKLLGKVLRIDVAGNNGLGGEYGIPADNPFVGVAGVREEIYAYGLRNPWRGTFDGDRFIVADVGQGLVEEVNLIEKGGNYGWRIKEGTLDFDPTTTPDPVVPLIDPLAQYTRPTGGGPATGLLQVGISVTGGAVYRGSEFPELDGVYLFGDFTSGIGGFGNPSGTLLALTPEMLSGSSPDPVAPIILDVLGGNPIGEYVLAFGLDENGEVYVATKTALAASGIPGGPPTGAIYRLIIVPEPTAGVVAILILGLGLLGSRRLDRRLGYGRLR